MMVGRARELELLRRLAAARRPQLAIVGGEAGIGKTRLIRELLTPLPAETVVLVGHAEPGSLARPYEVLLDALDGWTGRAGATRDDGGQHDLPRIDPGRLDALADPARSAVERLYTGLEIVADLVGDRPSVVVFEDLHWADSESAALFERLADQGEPALPRLLIGTYRPGELTSRHPVATLIERLERRHAVTRLELARFDEAETAAMLASVTGGPAPYRVVATLHRRTGGNPFFLEELLRGHGHDDLAAMCDQPLPWSLAEVLRRQVEVLEPRTVRIAEAAAVLGHRIPFDLLAAVTGAGEAELIDAMRELVARGVLVESGEDEFGFRHALVHEAVAGRLLGRERRRLHEAALDALLAAGSSESAGSDPAMIAHHAQAAGRYDDMVEAARRGTRLYLSIGSAYQALRLAEMGLAEDRDDTELLAGAARAAWLSGLLDDAIRYARRWRDGAGTLTERADALYLMIRLAWESDDLAAAAELTREVELLMPELPAGRDQAAAMAALAQSMLLRDQIEAALVWADRALEMAREHDLPRVRLAALVEKGAALTDRWETNAEGGALLTGLIDEAEKLGEWLLAARALHNLVQHVPPTSPAEHAEMLERMRIDAERAGSESLAVAAYFQGRARLSMYEGDLQGAIAALEQGRTRERGYLHRSQQADYHGVFLAGLYLEAGELDLVEEIIGELRALTKFTGLAVPGLTFHLACRRGDLRAAEQTLDQVFAELPVQTWRSGAQAHDLISAALHAGLPPARLERMAAELLDAAVWDDYQALVGAQLAEVRGEAAAALEGYRSILDSVALPAAVRGTAHVGAARCLLRADRRRPAGEHAEAAAELLARWDGWRVAELDAVRAQLGMAPPGGRRAVTGAAALTPRERQVALLIAEGLTNVELARRLHISPRTAAVHVSNILHKLGVARRTEVGAAVAAVIESAETSETAAAHAATESSESAEVRAAGRSGARAPR